MRGAFEENKSGFLLAIKASKLKKDTLALKHNLTTL
jgi:hypothetical protein